MNQPDQLPELPKHDHAFADLEGDEPDILLWRDYNMHAYALTAIATERARADALQAENSELRAVRSDLLASLSAVAAHKDAALKRADALEAALRELVALKDLNEQIELHSSAGEVECEVWAIEARADYNRRKPLAWAAGRALIEPTKG